eukprot:s5704_g4.t1
MRRLFPTHKGSNIRAPCQPDLVRQTPSHYQPVHLAISEKTTGGFLPSWPPALRSSFAASVSCTQGCKSSRRQDMNLSMQSDRSGTGITRGMNSLSGWHRSNGIYLSPLKLDDAVFLVYHDVASANAELEEAEDRNEFACFGKPLDIFLDALFIEVENILALGYFELRHSKPVFALLTEPCADLLHPGIFFLLLRGSVVIFLLLLPGQACQYFLDRIQDVSALLSCLASGVVLDTAKRVWKLGHAHERALESADNRATDDGVDVFFGTWVRHSTRTVCIAYGSLSGTLVSRDVLLVNIFSHRPARTLYTLLPRDHDFADETGLRRKQAAPVASVLPDADGVQRVTTTFQEHLAGGYHLRFMVDVRGGLYSPVSMECTGIYPVISMDCCSGVQSARSAAIIPEEDAAYRTFTCRGRRGATLALCGIRSEKARFVAEVLARDFTTSQRQQVIHVASDAPSSELFVVLKKVLPNLRSLSLDAMHIVIVYDQNTNNKRTTGSKWLSVIMNKFRKAHPTRTAASWGAFFDGSQVPTATPDVRAMRLRLDDPDMSEETSRRFLENINPDEPWLTEVDLLEALVAHASFFWDDLQKTTYSGITLHRLIANVASAVKFQWLLNDTRYRHSVDRRELTLLPSGTTSNESLHHELNTWFRETAACLHSRNIARHFLLYVGLQPRHISTSLRFISS